MKKLLLLGGLRYLIPVIEAAHKQGYYVITADYLPDNIAHKYSDEYINVSIIDKEAVLEEARKHDIDGIMAFAVDPGVVTASYVQNKLNLPKAKGYSSVEDVLKDSKNWEYPVIVKPTDSAGTKVLSELIKQMN